MAAESRAAPERRDRILHMAITPFHFDASDAEDERLWRQVSGKKQRPVQRKLSMLHAILFAFYSR
jgi:hypothetical protein